MSQALPRWMLLLALISMTSLGGGASDARPHRSATVLSIGDGDTIRVRHEGRQRTVRLACIDAPELAQRPDGDRSRRYLSTRLPIGSPVHLRVKTTDRYGRIVAEVIGEINLNLALVEDGQAFTYPKYLHQCDAPGYQAAERRASRRRHGVWRVPGGITRPWMFRRGIRSPSRRR